MDILLRRADPAHWEARLSEGERLRLLELGHFPEYGGELDWTPIEVAGHLAESASVFATRLHRLRAERRPFLADFETTDKDRVTNYRRWPRSELLHRLADAQRKLREVAASVTPHELERSGEHEVAGDVQIGDIMAFLPAHQGDHAEQLESLLSPVLPQSSSDS